MANNSAAASTATVTASSSSSSTVQATVTTAASATTTEYSSLTGLSLYVLNKVYTKVSPQLIGNMQTILSNELEISPKDVYNYYDDLGVISLDNSSGQKVIWDSTWGRDKAEKRKAFLRKSAIHPDRAGVSEETWTDDNFRTIVKDYIKGYQRKYLPPQQEDG